MNLKALAARFVELHPQYKYDLTNHVWVIADPSVEGGYLYPTSDRLIGDEVQALTVAMVDGNNADNRAKRPKAARKFQYLHGEFVKPLRAACRVRLPKRHIPWDDVDQLEKLPGWRANVESYRGRMFGCWHTRRDMPWIEVSVTPNPSCRSEWRAYACGTALNGNRPKGQGSVCRLDALRRLLDSAPWLRKGLAGPDAAVSHPSN
jgi:hypothetical protein